MQWPYRTIMQYPWGVPHMSCPLVIPASDIHTAMTNSKHSGKSIGTWQGCCLHSHEYAGIPECKQLQLTVDGMSHSVLLQHACQAAI